MSFKKNSDEHCQEDKSLIRLELEQQIAEFLSKGKSLK